MVRLRGSHHTYRHPQREPIRWRTGYHRGPPIHRHCSRRHPHYTPQSTLKKSAAMADYSGRRRLSVRAHQQRCTLVILWHLGLLTPIDGQETRSTYDQRLVHIIRFGRSGPPLSSRTTYSHYCHFPGRRRPAPGSEASFQLILPNRVDECCLTFDSV